MIIFGTCVGGTGERYRTVALPSIERAAEAEDVILTAPGQDGICSAYNSFLRQARGREDCEAVVLLHDDVEIVDPNFRPKILAALAGDNVGVVGAIGGAGLKGLAWWEAREKAGRVFESRGLIDHGDRRRDVDAVDGLMLILAPSAFQSLSFDEESFPLFHGYDVDYCLQARSAGLRVTLAPIDLLHRTKGGFGDVRAFEGADKVLATKWGGVIRPATPLERVLARVGEYARTGRRAGAGALRRLRSLRAGLTKDPSATPEPSAVRAVEPAAPLALPESILCPCCTTTMQRSVNGTQGGRGILRCPACGTGATWPPPSRDVEGDGLWLERYGASRLARRPLWMSQALKRVEWLQLYVAEGCLLEIGSGTGEFLKVASDQGYEAYGVETSHWAAEESRRLGTEVETGYLSDWRRRYAGLRPDVVAMWHVLEHVPDPAAFLDEVRRTLRPGGTVVLEVPNGGSKAFERLGLDWDAAQPDDHFFHFTPAGMTPLLETAGFTVQHVLPISRRVYAQTDAWQRERNDALVAGTEWPALDLLRVVCTANAS